MIIKKLSIAHCHRLKNTGITEINVIPNNKITLIVGQNGCGKSSLLRELSPLPAIPQDYTKEGYKYIEVLYNKKTYYLLSDFSSSHKHSFRVDGEELNASGTLQVQRELVKQHFGITQEIHELMLGVKAFHKMSPKERNDWFNKLCSADYSFAISFFNKIKEKTRDIQGALSLIKSKKMQELNKKDNLEQKNGLIVYKKQLEEQLDHLLKFSNNSDPNILNNLLADYETNKTAIKEEAYKLNDVIKKSSYGLITLTDMESMNNTLISLEKNISMNDGLIKALGSELSSLNKLNDISTNKGEAQDISNRIKEIELMLNNNKESTYKFDDPSTAYKTLVSIKDQLIVLLSEISTYDGTLYNDKLHKDNIDVYNVLNEKISSMNNEINKINYDLKSYEDIKSICPKCNFSWYKGVKDEDIDNLKNRLAYINSQINVEKDKRDKLKEYLETSGEYLRIYKQISSLLYGTPVLNKLWLDVSKEKMVTRDPNKLKSLLELVTTDLKKDTEELKLVEELKYLKGTLDIINKSEVQGVNNITVRLNEVHSKIDEIYEVNNKLNKEIKLLEDTKLNYKNIEKYKASLDNFMDKNTLLVTKIRNVIEACKVSKLISHVRKELEIVNSKINECVINEQHLMYLEKEEQEQNEQLEFCKILQNSMSPKTGLLALGMSGFINDTLRRMNDIISKIWTYPMELLPCSIDEGENLDYRFSIKIGNDNVINDINIGSSAMKEIVDLSFRLVTMKYLNLEHYPIYIDELGASFDEKHREQAFKLIKNMAESEEFSQLFLISHYSDSYSALSNVNTIVLCNENITISDSLRNSSCCEIIRN